MTLATNDSYSVGALTLAHSLRRVQTTKKVVIMITEEVGDTMKTVLREVFDQVIVVDPLDSKDLVHLELLDRTELGITFTKVSSISNLIISQSTHLQIHCWTLTDYTKCVFLDADTLILQNSDELFEREEFSAAPDAGWPDCFNSGVFVFRPNLNTFKVIYITSNVIV